MPIPDDQEPVRAQVAADVERPDTLVFGLTLRQVVILGGTGLVLWTGWTVAGHLAPIVFLVLAVPIAAAAFAVAVGRRDGMSLDAWLLAAIGHRRRPHRLVTTGGGLIDHPPAWIATTGAPQPLPAPLRLPARGITADGLIDLGADGCVALIAASTVNYELRSNTEQAALVGAIGQWLHSLGNQPLQILIRSQRVDLRVLADRIADRAPSLPHPALENAARAHAQFLDELAVQRDLLDRQVLIAVRDTRSPAHALHRATATARALAACEVRAHVLDGPQTAAALVGCLAPDIDSLAVNLGGGDWE